MYSVVDLSKMFNVSRKTVYEKLEKQEVKEYVFTDENGTLKLQQEGLSHFQMLIANSKVKPRLTSDKQEVSSDEFRDKYIESLCNQIDNQQKQIDNLNIIIENYASEFKRLVDVNKTLTLMLEKRLDTPLLPEKTSWIDKIFKKQ